MLVPSKEALGVDVRKPFMGEAPEHVATLSMGVCDSTAAICYALLVIGSMLLICC